MRPIGVLLVAAVLTGCSGRGTVSGDVYFAGADGEGKRASGVVVRLAGPAQAVDSTIQQTCATSLRARVALLERTIAAESAYKQLPFTSDGRRQAARMSLEIAGARDTMADFAQQTLKAVNRAIDALTVDSVVTGIDAKFRFANVRNGEYAVLARGMFASTLHAWATKVVVGRDSTLVSLGDRQDRGVSFYCQVAPTDLISDGDLYRRRAASDNSSISTLVSIETYRAKERREQQEADREQQEADRKQQANLKREAERADALRAVISKEAGIERSFEGRAVNFDRVDVRPAIRSGDDEYIHIVSPNVTQAGIAVAVRFIVDTDGFAKGIVVEAIDQQDLVEGIIKQFHERRYSPGKKDGKDVPVRMKKLIVVR